MVDPIPSSGPMIAVLGLRPWCGACSRRSVRQRPPSSDRWIQPERSRGFLDELAQTLPQDALDDFAAKDKIDTGNFQFIHELVDIETAAPCRKTKPRRAMANPRPITTRDTALGT